MDEELQNHINQILKTLNENNDIRLEGEAYIADLRMKNCSDLIRLSCNVILSDQIESNVVIQLSYILFNQSSIYLMNTWQNFSFEQQNLLRQAAMRGLFFADQVIRNLASYSFCLVINCGFETFHKDLLESLATPICNTEYPPCCTIGCFMALKELISHDILPFINKELFPFYNEIGNTITSAYEKIMSNPKVFDVPDFIEFLDCYSTILPYFHNFYINQESKKTFLDLMMNVYVFVDIRIHTALYHLLFSFFKCFYEQIDSCMFSIFEITKNNLCMGDPQFIFPSINFWSEVAKFEIAIIKQKNNVKNIISLSAPNLIAPMMTIITNFANDSLMPSVELQKLEEMNSLPVLPATVDCLQEFSALTNDVFKILTSQFDERKKSENWRDRIAALYSLYCISMNDACHINVLPTEGFFLNNFYEAKFDDIVNLTKDPNEIVRVEAFSIIMVIFRSSSIASQGRFLKKASTLFNENIYELNKELAENQHEISDIIPLKICDAIHEIAKHKLIPGESNREPSISQEEIKLEQKQEKVESNSDDIFKIVGCQNPSCPFSVYFFKFLRNLFDIFVFPAFQAKQNLELQEKCTETIATMFLATPLEQQRYVLQHYLPIILSYLNSHLEIQEELFDQTKIDKYIRISELCIILTSIIQSSGTAIGAFSEPIITILIRCLYVKHMSTHEEALTAMTNIINIVGSFILPANRELIFELIKIFNFSQESQNNLIIKRSAKLMKFLLISLKDQIGIIGQDSIYSIFNIFLSNLNNTDISLDTRLEILTFYGQILLELKIAAQPFFEPYYNILFKYQELRFNFLLDDDKEMAAYLYSTVLMGLGNLLKASVDLPFNQNIWNDFNKIVRFLDMIGNYKICLNYDVKLSILCFLESVLDCFKYIQRSKMKISNMLHSKVIKEMLYYLKNDENDIIYSKAISVSNRIYRL